MEEHTGFTRENKHNQLSIYTDSHELRCSMRKKAVDFRLKGKRALKRRLRTESQLHIFKSRYNRFYVKIIIGSFQDFE